jgi:hypothetical protein
MDLSSAMATAMLPVYEQFLETYCKRQTPRTKAVLTLALLEITSEAEVVTILTQNGWKEDLKGIKEGWVRKLLFKHKHTLKMIATKVREAK